MNHLTADEAMCDLLRGLLELLEIRDAKGNLLGTYTPYVSEEVRAAYERARNLFDLDEIQARRETEGEGRPLAEVWKSIKDQARRQRSTTNDECPED
jgi:hypothetical protein